MDLKPFQEIGADFLFERKYALLADEMRVGKTPQAIRCIDMLCKMPVIVICPACAIINWEREIRNFSVLHWPIKILFKGTDKPLANGINICSYNQAVSKNLLPELKKLKAKVIILDETHYLKNKKANRTRAIYGKRFNSVDSIMEFSENVYALTGTPVPNDPSELWTMLRAFKIYNKDFWTFQRTFCKGFDNGFGFKVTGGKNIPKLKAILAPIMLRRKLEEVMPDLKPLEIEQYMVKAAIVDEERWYIEAKHGDCKKRKKNVALQNKKIKEVLASDLDDDEKLAKLAHSNGRAVSTARKFTALSKVEPVCKLVEEMLLSGIPNVVIFAYHRDVIMGIRDGLSFLKPGIIWGATNATKKQKILDKFASGRTRVLICNLVAAGIAIDLTASSDMLMVEMSYVPGENLQAMARCQGINQRKIVNIKIISIPNSMDFEINKILERKINTIKDIFA